MLLNGETSYTTRARQQILLPINNMYDYYSPVIVRLIQTIMYMLIKGARHFGPRDYWISRSYR